MKILLTGPHGQIGWELSRCLPRLGQVIPVDRTRLDLADAHSIRATLRAVRPDLIVNAAGYTAVDRAESQAPLSEAVNATGSGILAEEAAEIGAALISYSTDYVFDGAKRTPYGPEDEPHPLNTYGRTKLEGERRILASGASAIVLRTSWVYSMRRSNFVLTMLRMMAVKPEIRVVDDQYGCPSWSRRIAEGTAKIIERGLTTDAAGRVTFGEQGGTYHLACTGVTTWCELARRVFELVRADPMPRVVPITSGEYPTAAKRPPYSALDCAITQATFGVDLGPWDEALEAALKDDAAVAAAWSGQRKEES